MYFECMTSMRKSATTTKTHITSANRRRRSASLLGLWFWTFFFASGVPLYGFWIHNRHGANGSLFCIAYEFNTQIMARVTERLDDYLNNPVAAANRLLIFRKVGSFPHGMTALDHDMINRYLLMEEISETRLYFGLEDGSFFFYSNVLASYREPGDDGYNVDKIDINDPNYKHYVSCIDDETFEQIPCIALNGTKYVSCVNNCSLVPCLSSQASQASTTSLYTSSQSGSIDIDGSQFDTASPTTIWCASYTIKYVNNDTDVNTLGYIPRNRRCSNRNGQPEQRLGYVLVDKDDLLTDMELGNCYYADGVTLVNRTIEGPYAACGRKKNCSLPTRGAVSTMPYDPRYRGWYVDTKQRQQPTWTAPYVYASGQLIGITYSQPLYNDIPPLTDYDYQQAKKRIFQGVVAVDYPLDKINNFLTLQYSDSDMQVLIVERSSSEHYLIATSTRGGDVLNLVLNSNPTQLCPKNMTDYERLCTVTRVPISDLDGFDTGETSESDDDQRIRRANMVLYRAFVAHKAAKFPEAARLNIQESPDIIGSPAYVAQGQMYQLGGNNSSPGYDGSVQWQILVVVPMPRLQQDAALPGSTSFMIVSMIASIGFVTCLVIFVQFYIKRKEKAMIHADWRFTSAFILGCTTLNLSTFALLGENTNQSCMLRMWSFNGLLACALSPLFVKVWRMAMLLRVEVSYKRESLNNYRAFLYTLPLISIQLVILLIFSVVDPPRQTEHLGVGDGVGYQQITCEQKTYAFFYTQVTFDALLISIGCVLAYKTKDLDPKFGEAKQLGFSMYNIAFTGIVVVLTIRLVDLDRVSQIIIQAIAIFWGSFFCSFAFVLPRLLEVHQYRRATQSSLMEPSSLYLDSHTRKNNQYIMKDDTAGGCDEAVTPEKTEFCGESLKSFSLPPLILSRINVDDNDDGDQDDDVLRCDDQSKLESDAEQDLQNQQRRQQQIQELMGSKGVPCTAESTESEFTIVFEPMSRDDQLKNN